MRQDVLLKEKTGKLYARFCSASVLGMVGISIYILADTFFIANGIGQTALAALNIALPVFSLVMATGMLFGIGAATCFSVARGGGDDARANSYFKLSILCGVIMGLVYILLGQVFPGEIAYALGATPETIDYCRTYLQVILTFAPAFMLNNIFLAFVRNIGRPNLAMVSMLAGSIFNIIFDYLTVYVWGMGMFGAAIATAFSPIVGISVMLPVLASKKSGLHFKGIRVKLSQLKGVLSGGMSCFIVELSTGIVVFILNAIMLRLLGNLGVAAYGIIANVTIVAYSIFTGMGQALQPIASVNYGAMQHARVKNVFTIACITALVTGVLLYIFGTSFAGEITAVFNGAQDPQLAALTEGGIKLYFIAYIPMGINVVLSYFFQSVLDMKRSVVISLLRGLVLISLGAVLLSGLLGVDGVWLSAPFAEVGTLIYAVISCVFWFRRHRPAEKEQMGEIVA